MADLLVRDPDGKYVRSTYWSLDEFAAEAERLGRFDWVRRELHESDSWAMGTLDDAISLAREGWQDMLPETLAIAESAVTSVFKVAEVDTWLPVHDVTGCDVDIDRYLSGEPENMIEYPSQKISKAGKVITLCAGISVSAAYSPEEMMRRGQIISALALALQQLGHSTELWADVSGEAHHAKFIHNQRILVKGANDVIDPARILYAYAHPSMLRRLAFANARNLPESDRRKGCGRPGAYGFARDPREDLPEGTIYLPSKEWIGDEFDAATELIKKLGELGLIESES